MRIAIKFEPEGGQLVIPIHYNHIVQAMIYSSLDSALADWYHNEGYSYGKRHFKLFTFSRLICKGAKYLYDKKQIEFSKEITLKISAVDDQLLVSLARYIVRQERIRLGNNNCELLYLGVENYPRYREKIIVKAISPIVAYRTLYTPEGRKKTVYFSPWDSEFSDLVLSNLERKAKVLNLGEAPSLDSAYIKPFKVSEKNLAIINFKGTWIKGWSGLYEISVPKPYFKLAFDAGLGSKNSQGFGMIEFYAKRRGKKGAESTDRDREAT
ncbi:MAG: CRISPR-associated endoribonuclease Cas6 [Synergistetes bacterium]|nr:CRISPR-associated endoribonuclease Cas6 [Synergistota bacterium]